MNAALAIADQGYEVVLVEKEERLGGMAQRLQTTIEGWDIQRYLQELICRVQSHPRIQALTRALIVGFGGFKGNSPPRSWSVPACTSARSTMAS